NVDRATFDASVTAATVDSENFDGFADGTFLGVVGDVTFFTSGGGAVITDDFATSTAPNSLGSITTFAEILGSGGEQATFAFANPITAFAIDIITTAVGAGAYQADIGGDNADSIDQVFPGGPTGQFIGFTSTIPFTSVTISAVSGFDFTLDTLVFGQAANLVSTSGPPTDVAEPSALLLLSGGLLGIAWATRRRRRRSIARS
ncbi:MAG: PEP-CTERM sorting domain-containing protein, partial [Pseudomonadota bacterium]